MHYIMLANINTGNKIIYIILYINALMDGIHFYIVTELEHKNLYR